MATFIENPEIMEQAEKPMAPEVQNPLVVMYLENIQEAQQAGNEDMAEYYREKLEAMEQQATATDNTRLGGSYGGYTEYQWRQMAKDEFVKNGDSPQYKRYCDNALKAHS